MSNRLILPEQRIQFAMDFLLMLLDRRERGHDIKDFAIKAAEERLAELHRLYKKGELLALREDGTETVVITNRLTLTTV